MFLVVVRKARKIDLRSPVSQLFPARINTNCAELSDGLVACISQSIGIYTFGCCSSCCSSVDFLWIGRTLTCSKFNDFLKNLDDAKAAYFEDPLHSMHFLQWVDFHPDIQGKYTLSPGLIKVEVRGIRTPDPLHAMGTWTVQ
jgi:hypothetical protein